MPVPPGTSGIPGDDSRKQNRLYGSGKNPRYHSVACADQPERTVKLLRVLQLLQSIHREFLKKGTTPQQSHVQRMPLRMVTGV